MLILYTLQRGRLPTIGWSCHFQAAAANVNAKAKVVGAAVGSTCQSLSLKGLPFPD